MSTRDGRRDRRNGTSVPDDQKQQSNDTLIKEMMSKIYDAIQTCLVDRHQYEISAIVQIFDGSISRFEFGLVEVSKPSLSKDAVCTSIAMPKS